MHKHHHGTQRRTRPPQQRRGFTLVEMLVAVALVLLLMTLFAQVFQIAGSSVSTQRGLMENDQRARSVQTLLKGDLDKRTFRYLVPFTVNEDLTSSGAKLAQRRGYFYISENVVGNDTDDVLAFTVDARVVNDSADTSDFFGRAFPLATVRGIPNQPEGDDSRLDSNFTGTSPAAEVVYFLRAGNLYRRVLLIRNASSRFDNDQPTLTNSDGEFEIFSLSDGSGLMSPPPKYRGGLGGNNFWIDYDYSAHPRAVLASGGGAFLHDGCFFNTTDTLTIPLSLPTYSQMTGETDYQIVRPIAYPANRFGHSFAYLNGLVSSPANPPFGGQPREYDSSGNFVGRLTMEETSFPPPPPASNSTYPFLSGSQTNTYADSQDIYNYNGSFTWTVNSNDRVVDEFRGGPRRGEDLVLSNVHSFDVKVYDEILGRYVDIGHSLSQGSTPGDFNFSNRKNEVYGALGSSSRVFDTWYPFASEDVNANNSIDNEDSDNDLVLDAGEDTDSDGMLDLSEDRNGNGDITEQRFNFDPENGTGVSAYDDDGDGIFDRGENFPPYRPLRARPVVSSGGYTPYERWIPNSSSTAASRYALGNRVFPPSTPQGARFGDPFYYVVVAETDRNSDGTISHSPATSLPSWPEIDGIKFDDGEITWQAVDNRKPLRGIQITIRFLDRTTQQLRTLTIQQGLVDSDQ